MVTEADTCRKYVLPKLYAAGWNLDRKNPRAKEDITHLPPEQRRIVAELHALQGEVDTLKHLQAETAAELDALLPSVLDRAFRGAL